MTDAQFQDIVRNAAVPYRLNLAPGDSVLIVTDTAVDPMIVKAFVEAAVALDIRPCVATTLPLPFHHAEPEEMVIKAAAAADLVHLVTSVGAIHAKSFHQLQASGKRFVASEEVTLEMLRSGAARADYDRMNQIGERYYEILQSGSQLRIMSSKGTDLRGQIGGRPPWLAAGKVRENPGIDLNACGFPDGEVGISPVESTIEGTIVWDTTMHAMGLLEEPIRAKIREGRAVEITGGRQAGELIEYLERNGDEGSWFVGETSIGLNPEASITGFVRTDKKLAGSCHIALGMNADTGGKIASATHIDGVIRRPTWIVDEQTLVRDGELVEE